MIPWLVALLAVFLGSSVGTWLLAMVMDPEWAVAVMTVVCMVVAYLVVSGRERAS